MSEPIILKILVFLSRFFVDYLWIQNEKYYSSCIIILKVREMRYLLEKAGQRVIRYQLRPIC